MSKENIIKSSNSNITINPNYYILSSWNYGSYSPTNPFYKTYIKYFTSKLSKTNPNISTNKKPVTTISHDMSMHPPFHPQSSKTKIVTNDLLENINFEKKMKRHLSKGTFKPKNMNRIIKPTKVKEYNIKKKRKIRKIKTDITDYKYKLNFSEWLNIKNKQSEYFNSMIKKNQEEEKIRDEENKKIEIKYNHIKELKYKEWCYKKKHEFIIKNEIKKQIEKNKERERKKKLERKEEIMNSWFKAQAEKLEKEILTKRKQRKEEKEKQNLAKKKILEKKIKGKEAFLKWREEKDKDKIRKKQEEKIQKKKEEQQKKKEEEQKKKDYLKKRVKSFIIGPYTGAADLSKALYNILETNLSKENNQSI